MYPLILMHLAKFKTSEGAWRLNALFMFANASCLPRYQGGGIGSINNGGSMYSLHMSSSPFIAVIYSLPPKHAPITQMKSPQESLSLSLSLSLPFLLSIYIYIYIYMNVD